MNKVILFVGIGLVVLVIIFGLVFVFLNKHADSNQTNMQNKPVKQYDFRTYRLDGNIFYSNADTNFLYLSVDNSAGCIDNTKIKTDNGTGKIVFNDAVYSTIDYNSEVDVKKVDSNSGIKYVEIEQLNGRSIHRIFGFGGKVNYSILADDLRFVASGTCFVVDVSNNKIMLGVSDGNVVVYSDKNNFVVLKDQQMIYSNGTFSVGAFNPDEWVRKNITADEKIITARKDQMMDKYGSKLTMAKIFSKEITDERVDYYLDVAARDGIDAAKAKIESDFGFTIPDKYLK